MGRRFRAQRSQLGPAAGTMRNLSKPWTAAVERWEPGAPWPPWARQGGSGYDPRAGSASNSPACRILSAAVPSPADVEAWLSSWVPELATPTTSVVVENVDQLSAWAAQELPIQALRALRSLPGKNADEQARPV